MTIRFFPTLRSWSRVSSLVAIVSVLILPLCLASPRPFFGVSSDVENDPRRNGCDGARVAGAVDVVVLCDDDGSWWDEDTASGSRLSKTTKELLRRVRRRHDQERRRERRKPPRTPTLAEAWAWWWSSRDDPQVIVLSSLLLSCFLCCGLTALCVRAGLITADEDGGLSFRLHVVGDDGDDQDDDDDEAQDAAARRTLTTEEAMSLPTAHWNDDELARYRDRTCVVCLEDYASDDTLRVLSPCGHSFHSHCIVPWLTERSKTCPLCQTEVVPVPLKAKTNKSVLSIEDDRAEEEEEESEETESRTAASTATTPEARADNDPEEEERSSSHGRRWALSWGWRPLRWFRARNNDDDASVGVAEPLLGDRVV